ncbi:MAG: hypothetical protein AB1763_09445 [Campylobacterota bacterium]
MIATFQSALIEHLQATGLNVKEYFGEFDRPEQAKIFKTFLPGVMVDFVEAKPDELYRENVTFSLYIAHVTYSAQEQLRSETNVSLLDYIFGIRQSLMRVSVGGSDPINVIKYKKIFDAAKDSAYLNVYLMTITATLYNQTINEEIA